MDFVLLLSLSLIFITYSMDVSDFNTSRNIHTGPLTYMHFLGDRPLIAGVNQIITESPRKTYQSENIRIWSLNGIEIQNFNVEMPITWMSASDDGTLISSLSNNQFGIQKSPIYAKHVPSPETYIAPYGDPYLSTYTPAPSHAAVFDVETQKKIVHIKSNISIDWSAITPDNKSLFIFYLTHKAEFAGGIKVYDLPSGKYVKSHKRHFYNLINFPLQYTAQFNPLDSIKFFSYQHDESFPQSILQNPGNGKFILASSWSPNGTFFATVSEYNPMHISVWNTHSGQLITSLENEWSTWDDEETHIQTIHFFDENHLIAFDKTQTVQMWNIQTKEKKELTANNIPYLIHSNKEYIALALANGTVDIFKRSQTLLTQKMTRHFHTNHINDKAIPKNDGFPRSNPGLRDSCNIQ